MTTILCGHATVSYCATTGRTHCETCGTAVRIAPEPPPRAREHLFDILARDGQFPRSTE